jgi:hypothetical protein
LDIIIISSPWYRQDNCSLNVKQQSLAHSLAESWNFMIFLSIILYIYYSNMNSFCRFVDQRAIYRWYNLIRTCAGECDWLFHWQHKLCATFSANVNINYRLPIKVYYRICTLRHIRTEINHGSQNVFWVLTWVGGY